MQVTTDHVHTTLTRDYPAMKRRLVGAMLADGASRHDADEQAHNALVETWARAERVLEPAAVLGYSRTIAKRTHWRDTRRAQRAVPTAHDELPPVAALHTPESICDRRAIVEQMAAAFAELSQRDRDMLWERHVDDRPCEEIAARHGLSASSVPTILLRARRRLRSRLADLEVS